MLKTNLKKNIQPWSSHAGQSLYGVSKWSEGFFSVTDAGDLAIHYLPDNTAKVSLPEIVQSLRKQGIYPPFILHFPHIIEAVLRRIQNAFSAAMTAANYQQDYLYALPLKVNPSKSFISKVFSLSQQPIALEVGSKSELLAALSFHEAQAIIVNGYKDYECFELIAEWSKIGKLIYPVINNLHEFILYLHFSQKQPLPLGVRLRLLEPSHGRWEDSSGDNAKFGLTTIELWQLCQSLKKTGRMECLKLLHLHAGSQLPYLETIALIAKEMGRYCVELSQLGFQIEYLDLGGGLGVDYNGTNSGEGFSCEYSVEEYAQAIVSNLVNVLAEHNVKHPCLITESGRACSAQHGVFIFNAQRLNLSGKDTNINNGLSSIFEAEDAHNGLIQAIVLDGTEKAQPASNPTDDATHVAVRSALFSELEALKIKLRADNPDNNGSNNDGSKTADLKSTKPNIDEPSLERLRANCAQQFRLGTLDLATLVKIRAELDSLRRSYPQSYRGNFSLFKSVPDSWAIGQEFPVVPLQWLNQRPDVLARIHDLTCDSDGRLLKYVLEDGVQPYIWLHEADQTEDYYLGIFMIGAYQEVLGEQHNLLGDTPRIDVAINAKAEFSTKLNRSAQSCADILSAMGFANIDADLHNAALQLGHAPNAKAIRLSLSMLAQTPYLRPEQVSPKADAVAANSAQHLHFGADDLQQTNYDEARVVICPLPYEATTSWKKGTEHAPQAILEASCQLERYDEQQDALIDEYGIITMPLLKFDYTNQRADLNLIKHAVEPHVATKKHVVGLGGEHSITLPIVEALVKHYSNFGIIQIDAHADLRHDYEGSIYNHACVMRRIFDLDVPVHAVGIRSLSPEEIDFIRNNHLEENFYWAHRLNNDASWIDNLLNKLPDTIYITIDVDGLDPSIMMATGTPEPGGLGWYDLLNLLAKITHGRRVLGFDVNELLPQAGFHANHFLAARLVYKLIGYLSASRPL